MTDNFKILESIRFESKKWFFSDLRINIPPMSLGSDAANPHTQYSNAIASFEQSGLTGFGACFTLGEGNQFVCAAAEYIVRRLDGVYLSALFESSEGFAEILGNPLQLRWLSPNAGLPMMAAGLVVNTLIDFASKKAGLPAWKYLASLEIEELLKLISLRHIREPQRIIDKFIKNSLDAQIVQERIEELEQTGLPAYFTTWIGSDAEALAREMQNAHNATGVNRFKMKIGSDTASEMEKIEKLLKMLPSKFSYAADANQKLDFTEAKEWISFLTKKNFLWLEEPFAPDNLLLFRDLKRLKSDCNWTCEIASGENCPNLQTAQALMEFGLDRFQADPCRMMGVSDGVFAGILSKYYHTEYTPHAGGAGLDELSSHLQFFYLTRVDPKKPVKHSLTETIGFCSKFYESPTKVEGGRIQAPRVPGLLVGMAPEISKKLTYFGDGVTWIEL